MNADLAQELLNVLGSSLENLETQHAALLQCLKDAGVVTDDQLAPYLTQAGKASSVRWRAAHIRLDRLFATEKQKEEQRAEKAEQETNAAQAPVQDQGSEAQSKNERSGAEAAPQPAAADANAAKESAGAQPASEKNDKKDEPATSEDKKTSPKQEKNGA